jgi:hypothetical protein
MKEESKAYIVNADGGENHASDTVAVAIASAWSVTSLTVTVIQNESLAPVL